MFLKAEVCVFACVRACVHAYVRVCAWMRACVCVLCRRQGTCVSVHVMWVVIWLSEGLRHLSSELGMISLHLPEG